MRVGRQSLSVPVRVFGCLIFSILFLPGILLAGVPGFSIDNSYEREQEFVVDDWVVTETFGQDYTFDWDETFSDRLDVNLEFRLTIEDIFKSNDVDTKEVTPSLELDLSSIIWDLGFSAEDTIEYTNEFNKERKDALEFSAELDLAPDYLPTFNATLQKLINEQQNLEDTNEEKIDLITTYGFGEVITLDASYKREKLDDRLLNNSDKDLTRWDFTTSFNQPMAPSLKLNIDTTLEGETEDTLNNSGQVILSERSRTLENRARLTLETWPNISSDLEITDERELVDDTDTIKVDFDFKISQEFLPIGILTERLEFGRERVKSPIPQDDVRDLDIGFTLEFAGNPSDYLDYSVKQSLDLTDSEFADTTKNTDTRQRDFDLSITITPAKDLSLDLAYNRSTVYTTGSVTSESRSYKIELTYEGEAFDFPNLTFNPSVEFSTDNDRVTNETTDKQTIDLEFTYTFNLPKVFVLVLEPGYTFERTDGVTENVDLKLAYEMAFILQHADWEFSIENDGEYTNNFGADDDYNNDISVQISVGLLGNIQFDVEYQYQTSDDSDNEDTLEASVDMEFDNATLSVSYENDRAFSTEKDVVRTWEVEFLMEF
ncbi:MAG: hypothetical protein ACC669_00165 [bacterium]